MADRLRRIHREPLTSGEGQEYIGTPEEHHCERSFAMEYLSLLKKHGSEYDEPYLCICGSNERRIRIPPLQGGGLGGA
jgi:hypothetical protein